MKPESIRSIIRGSMFDVSRNTSDAAAYWRIGSEAKDFSQSKPSQQWVQTASNKIERISALPEDAKTVIGGLCSIFTGDLASASLRSEASGIVRMDQIVESVGNVRGMPIFVIFEDSFFENLTGISKNQFQRQAEDAAVCIRRWLQLSTGLPPDLRTAYTSDPRIESSLTDAVQTMATDVLNAKKFAEIQAAPVLLMYTSYWSEILSSIGIIDSQNAICVEPTVHFVDDRKLPLPLSGAYDSFISWLKDNPYGLSQSDNSTYGIAGFMESYTGSMQKKRTRLLPYTQVPNTQNVLNWNDELQRSATLFPFPLKNSVIFSEAVNWGLWNADIQESLLRLILLEERYYAEKKQKKNTLITDTSILREASETQKNAFMQEAYPLLRMLSRETSRILQYVLKGSL